MSRTLATVVIGLRPSIMDDAQALRSCEQKWSPLDPRSPTALVDDRALSLAMLLVQQTVGSSPECQLEDKIRTLMPGFGVAMGSRRPSSPLGSSVESAERTTTATETPPHPIRDHETITSAYCPSTPRSWNRTAKEHPVALSTSLICVRTALLSSSDPRPQSHPQSATGQRHVGSQESFSNPRPQSLILTKDAWLMSPSLAAGEAVPVVLGPRPKCSFARLISMDELLAYRDEKRAWIQTSKLVLQQFPDPIGAVQDSEPTADNQRTDEYPVSVGSAWESETSPSASARQTPVPSIVRSGSKFRTWLMEVGFCVTIGMTQFLAEFLISGFAMELPHLLAGSHMNKMGEFLPASLLSLVLSAMLLISARATDMRGGYPCFMFGVIWLTIWTALPGFSSNIAVLDVARAMQGMAIAAFTPSAYAMIAANYPEGPRRNTVMGVYSGCAPLGFFVGMLTAGALPATKSQWYFWITSALSFTTAVAAYLTVPRDLEHRAKSELKMDWLGGFLITASLFLIFFALSLEPNANKSDVDRNGFSYPNVSIPLACGLGCLALSIWVEGWVATCPLLPLSFFRPTSAISLSLASLCFYAAYGVWLYMSVDFFKSVTGTTIPDDPRDITVALWYAPTAIGGLLLCILGSRLMHIIPIQGLLLVSGAAWIAAPLLLAVSPLPLNYWASILPSMLCATLGIDMTYTITCVFFSSVQPLKFQGLSGAVCSVLVNLAMSVALPIGEIVKAAAEQTVSSVNAADQTNWGYRAALVYGAASAGLGFFVAVFFVRISRRVVSTRPADEERPRATLSEAHPRRGVGRRRDRPDHAAGSVSACGRPPHGDGQRSVTGKDYNRS